MVFEVKTINPTWQTLIGLIDVAPYESKLQKGEQPALLLTIRRYFHTQNIRSSNAIESHISLISSLKDVMALNGGAPPRGSAAAAAANLRRRRTGGTGGAASGTAGNMLQFYTDDAPGLKISPNVVLVMSIGFIAFVAVLHVMGKLYFVRKE
uniref:Protein transport protein Sec61 subunit beta n=1 Tax=Helianthus annuus TaxID=4232 RepID=A0A251S185_HELAN